VGRTGDRRGRVLPTGDVPKLNIRNTILAIGIVVAAALGVFLFQGEVLIAIFLGAPSIIIIGGLLWLTHNLFAEAKP
jgi:hypothetical protein